MPRKVFLFGAKFEESILRNFPIFELSITAFTFSVSATDVLERNLVCAQLLRKFAAQMVKHREGIRADVRQQQAPRVQEGSAANPIREVCRSSLLQVHLKAGVAEAFQYRMEIMRLNNKLNGKKRTHQQNVLTKHIADLLQNAAETAIQPSRVSDQCRKAALVTIYISFGSGGATAAPPHARLNPLKVAEQCALTSNAS
ncbi:hypothetical protein CEXT_142881 [Caerostris extrusa]|uniref:Uncharacterized protein n=1 Tax=Caerostris extrusa TaxID=172846 RepID=A0AAV4RTI1_CAEEX|nr:hypothetical protein CEXT_142881 [Caerostris extrusa]